MNLKNIFKKQNVMPVAILGAICLVVAALMGAVNLITAPIIKKAEEQKVYDSLRVVLDGDFEQIDLPENSPATATGLYKVTEGGSLVGHVVTLAAKGYAGTISLTVGIDKDGKVTKAVVTNQSETHGKAGMANYTDGFAGTDAETAPEVSTFTGATISSTAIKNAIIDALNTVSGDAADPEEEEEETLPSSDAELRALANTMAGKTLTLTEIALSDAPEALKRAYDAGADGYFAYVVVPGQYVPVATEALIYLNADCKIVKAELLQWVVGHEVGAGNFADGFVGKDETNVDSTDLVTGATGTSVDFRNAASAVVKFFTNEYGLPSNDTELRALANTMAGKTLSLTELATDGADASLKRLYSSDDGFFAYIVVPGAYVAVATEALVQLDLKGKIVKVELLQWVVGHGVEPGDFANGFAGKDETNVDSTELVTGATGTAVDFRNAVSAAVKYVDANLVVEIYPSSDEEIKALAADMAGKELSLIEYSPATAPDALKRVYDAGADGYFLYIVVPGAYVEVATEAVVWLDNSCDIVKIELLQWVVGHGVEPGDFVNGFVGKDKNSIGGVELVAGATGTASDFRTAVEASVIAVADGDQAKETLLIKRMEKLVPNANGFEKLDVPTDAASAIKAIYKVVGFDGYVVYLITSTKYVAVETESLVYVNARREVAAVDLITWTVGHGVEPGDFATSLVGKNAATIEDVELVTGATVTAQNLRDAVAAALDIVPVNYAPTIIGAVVAALALGAAVAMVIIFKKRRAIK